LLNQPLNAGARQLCHATAATLGAAWALGNAPADNKASKQAAAAFFF
jgi:hypothetical protein